MNHPAPDLLTLLDWSQRLARGEHCAEWKAWRESSPDAAWQWPRVALAVDLLDAGELPEMAAEDVAAWLDGGLSEDAAAAAEQCCWHSPAQLAEVASAASFRDPLALLAAPTDDLTRRLLELGPQPAKWRLDGSPEPLPVASPLPPPAMERVTLPVVQPGMARRQLSGELPLWMLVSAAALVLVVLSGVIAWFTSTSLPREDVPRPIAVGPDRTPVPVPAPAPAPPAPEAPREPSPSSLPPQQVELPQQRPLENPSPQLQPAPKRSQPAIPPRRPAGPPPPMLAFRPAVGALLVQDGASQWRVGAGQCPLNGPMRIVSLAESWNAVEVPSVGKLICEGPAEAVLAPRDGGLEIALAHGRLGVQDLEAGKEIRFQAGGATWTARGLDHYSTLAILADPAAPQLLVPSGAVAVDRFNVAAQQRMLWQQGLPQAPQPIAGNAAAMNAVPPPVPALGDPLDLAWLQPPAEDRRKQFQTFFGKLVERLAAADDAEQELPKLLEASKDARTAALLSRWNAALADDASRAAQTWSMLSDRRLFVRAAGVRTLLELPPGDPRLARFDRLLRREVGDDPANRVQTWLGEVRQPTPLPGARAVELVEFLSHSEPALRQLAVSLLELHAAPGLARLHLQAPAFDAAGPAARRAAAQQEWRRLLRPIFAPRSGPAAALAPAAGS